MPYLRRVETLERAYPAVRDEIPPVLGQSTALP